MTNIQRAERAAERLWNRLDEINRLANEQGMLYQDYDQERREWQRLVADEIAKWHE